MPEPRKFQGGELVKTLRRFGFEIMLSKGNHHFVRDPDGRCTVVPAQAGETLGPGLLARIFWDAELTKKDLL